MFWGVEILGRTAKLVVPNAKEPQWVKVME